MLPAKSHAEGMDKVWQLHANFVKVYGMQAFFFYRNFNFIIATRAILKPTKPYSEVPTAR